jgi:hypothetical protein
MRPSPPPASRNARSSGTIAPSPAISRSAAIGANLYDLDFQPPRKERYDLVIPEAEFDAPAVRRLMEALNSGMLARAVSGLCSFDTAQNGYRAAFGLAPDLC